MKKCVSRSLENFAFRLLFLRNNYNNFSAVVIIHTYDTCIVLITLLFLAKCATVNKSWAHLLRQKELWKQKTIKKYGTSVTEKNNDPILACLTGIVVVIDCDPIQIVSFFFFFCRRKWSYSGLEKILFIKVIFIVSK